VQKEEKKGKNCRQWRDEEKCRIKYEGGVEIPIFNKCRRTFEELLSDMYGIYEKGV